MSRMKRYKHIHDKAKPIQEQSSSIEIRKKRETPLAQTSPAEAAPKKIKKTKKKRRIGWGKRLLIFFVLLLAMTFILFFKGLQDARTDSSLPKEETEVFHGVTSANGAHNILILGSDTRGEDAGRADTVMVLQVDGPSKKPKLVSFMRDSFVEIPEVGPSKLNAAYAYGGADLVRRTLKENFDIDTKYYAKVDFQSFEKIVDSLFPSGVTIDAEKDINLDGVDIAAGKQTMDGHVLLQYARFRMDEEGDFGRIRRQQQVMSAIMGQLKNPVTLTRAPASLGQFMGYISTDLPPTFLLKVAPFLAFQGTDVARLSIPIEGSWSDGYYEYAGSVLEMDFAANQQAIVDFLNE